MKVFYKLILFVCSIALVHSINAQQSGLSRGIELYEKGDFEGAISILSKSEDVKDLHYLGVSYEKTDQISKAKEVYKKSFETSYEIFFMVFDDWQKIEYSDSKKLFSDLSQELKSNLEFGYASAERAYKLKSNIFQRNEWRIKAKVLFDAKNLAKSGEAIYSSADKTLKKLNITEKPGMKFPRDIPSNMRTNLTKTITIFVVFGADGKIKLLMPTDKTINSLTITSMSSAEKIKFQPAAKDDKAVSVHAQISYSFTMF